MLPDCVPPNSLPLASTSTAEGVGFVALLQAPSITSYLSLGAGRATQGTSDPHAVPAIVPRKPCGPSTLPLLTSALIRRDFRSDITKHLRLFAGQARIEFERDERCGASSPDATVVCRTSLTRGSGPASIHGVREADWNASAIRRAGRDAKEHFRGFTVGVIGLAAVSAAIIPDSRASLVARVAPGLAAIAVLATAVFLVALLVAPYRQRNAARRHITRLEQQTSDARSRDRIIRNLEALRRDFLKNEPWLNSSSSNAVAHRSLVDALVSRLEDAEDELQAISPDMAGEFGDLARILAHNTDGRRTTIAQLQAEGKRLFDRAIDRLATRS